MAVPTFTSISPTTGPSRGGFMAVIDGTGFFTGQADTTVVEFDGEQAKDVRVLSSTRLTCIVPPYRGDAAAVPIPASSIRVQNLDEDFNVVPGEEVTAAGVFTYERPQLDGVTDLQRLVREVIHTLKRYVHPNVSVTVETDYDAETGDALNIIQVSSLPAVVLIGPDIAENRFYSTNEKLYDQDSLVGRQYNLPRTPKTVDVTFRIVGVADKTMILLNMMNAVEQLFEAQKSLTMDRSRTDPSAGRVSYEFELVEEPTTNSRPNASNVRHFEGSFVIRGFDVEMETIERTFEIDDVATDGEITILTEQLF